MTKDAEQTGPALSGPKSIFRRKVRTRPSVVLTKPGHQELAANLDRLDMSRSDFFEGLLHVFGRKMTRKDVEHVAERVNAESERSA